MFEALIIRTRGVRYAPCHHRHPQFLPLDPHLLADGKLNFLRFSTQFLINNLSLNISMDMTRTTSRELTLRFLA